MKYMIAGDIHGSAGYCGIMADCFEKENADRLLLLGDLLYHGPRNDLPDGYAPKKCIEILNGLKDNIMCVRGNCDAEVDQMVLDFPIMAEYLLLDSGKKPVYVTHGHHFNPSSPFKGVRNYILLTGHTHIPAKESCGDFIYINPGSVSIPKNGSCHSYMTLEDGLFEWKNLLDMKVYDSLKI